jgi:hypothetical protein
MFRRDMFHLNSGEENDSTFAGDPCLVRMLFGEGICVLVLCWRVLKCDG